MVGEEHYLVASGGLDVDDDRKRLVVDEHELGGVDPRCDRLGHDRDDRLADVADDVTGDERAAHRLGEHR